MLKFQQYAYDAMLHSVIEVKKSDKESDGRQASTNHIS